MKGGRPLRSALSHSGVVHMGRGGGGRGQGAASLKSKPLSLLPTPRWGPRGAEMRAIFPTFCPSKDTGRRHHKLITSQSWGVCPLPSPCFSE